MAPPQERRKYPRVNVEIKADASHGGSSTGTWTAHVLEMTLEGMTIAASRPLKPGTECALRMEDGPSISGTVVHSCEKKGAGVHVGIRLDLSPVGRMKLLRYIQDQKDVAH